MIRVNGYELTQEHFPDGTLRLNMPEADYSCMVDIEWRYENDAELFTLICARRYFEDMPVMLYLPYIPHARQDRVKRPTDVFTLKYFCEVINSLNFCTVVVDDAHSNVALALLDRVAQFDTTTHIEEAINDYCDENTVLFFPDEGSMKRYSDNIKLPYSFGIKKRDWQTGKILGYTIADEEVVNGKRVLIIDDICSRGGTFFHAARALKDAGATAIGLYVTHCENTILEGEIFSSGLIEKIYTTKSLVHKPELAERVEYV